ARAQRAALARAAWIAKRRDERRAQPSDHATMTPVGGEADWRAGDPSDTWGQSSDTETSRADVFLNWHLKCTLGSLWPPDVCASEYPTTRHWPHVHSHPLSPRRTPSRPWPEG